MRNQVSWSRRSFLKTSSMAGVALAFPSVEVMGANSKVGIAVIGLGNKGKQHVELLSDSPGAQVTGLCDVDPNRLGARLEKLKAKGITPYAVGDARRVLDRKDVDAVVIATPNHWHSLLAVWALRAGKDVYVEKPVSHNPWESARLVEEAKASGRVVQAGTQYRSCRGLRAAAAWLQEGHLGEPLWAQVVWYEFRAPIGKCEPFVPTEVDYDLWCGPAPLEPLNRPRLHYDWHWVWSTGDGDLGNSGIHAFDACRMFLPGAVFPRKVLSLGGRFGYDDAAETPNTQFTLLEYPQLPIIIENRNLSMEKDAVVMEDFRRIREGFVIQYEGGYFAGLRTGGGVFDSNGKSIRRFQGDGGAGHHDNFLEAIRHQRPAGLNAPIQEGHVSSSVCHLGNLSYRLGRPVGLDDCRRMLGDHAQVQSGFERLIRSLKAIDINPDDTRFVAGPRFDTDPDTGALSGLEGGAEELLSRAQALVRGTYRAPFVLPA